MVRSAWRAAIVIALAGMMHAPTTVEGQEGRGQGLEISGQGTKGQELHAKIDAVVEAGAVGPLAPECSDADFVRRVYLDLTGVIPTVEQARAFLNDPSANKRERLIEELIASPAFVRHMTITLDVMLMERKADKVVKQAEWEAFLFQSVAEDKALDQLFRELIAADGADEKLRAAARFTLDRDAEPNLVTRDIGRLAFGMDLQCCQCHDHPLIDDYYQKDYYGLFAFVQRTTLFTDPKTKLVSLTEKADGEASYKSVFTGDSSDRTLPQLPKGVALPGEPAYAKGEEYLIAPEKTVRGVPKFSRRQALAAMVPHSNEFRRNLANRLWAMIFGRGIVHPVDFHYSGNPPSNPELLSLLADALKTGGFALRPFVRELVLTRTYQRACDAPQPETVNFADIAARLEQLTRDQAAAVAVVAPKKSAATAARAELKTAREQDEKLAAEISKMGLDLAKARKEADAAAAKAKSAEEALSKLKRQAGAVAEAAAKAGVAVRELPSDEALASATKTMIARAAAIASESENSEKFAQEKRKSHESEILRVKAAEAVLLTAKSKRLTAEQLAARERAGLDAEHAAAAASFHVAAIDSRIALAKAMLDYTNLRDADPAKAEVAWSGLVERWTIGGQIAMLKPLTAEQLAASVMQAAAVFPAQVAEAPVVAGKPAQAKTTQLSALRGPASEFVKQYGGLPGQDFQATVNQALFFGNSGLIDGWLKPTGKGVLPLAMIDDPAQLADEMYLAAFSRPATQPERQDIARYLNDRREDRDVAVAEVVWALLSSTEFRFNH